MQEPIRRNANDPEVVRATAGLVAYLRELVLTAHRPIRDCASYQTQVWLADLPEGVERPSETADGVLLTLDHVPHAAPPALIEMLKGWVDQEALLDPAGPEPPLAEQGPGQVWGTDEDGSPALVPGTVPRQQAANVLRAYTMWLPGWRRWAQKERAARPRRELYERLAGIARRLAQQDDAFEVVLGVGLLAWEAPDGERVFRHLITTRVGIAIDRDTARLTVALTPETSARLEDRDFLDEQDGYVRGRGIRVQEQLAAEVPHPLSEEMAGLIARWQSFAMDRPVGYGPAWKRPATVDGTPRLVIAPALLLRERDRNAWVEYYDQIAASLTGPGAASALGLAQLLFPLEKDERLAWATSRSSTTGKLLGEEPLFPLKTNPEQRAVLERLQGDTAVVVQGPPGTGKTHTIANLISALLATGQRVLVTSQKAQALKALRDKLPGPVRDLCVLLTDMRRGGSDELERSVRSLSDRTATSDVDRIRGRIEHLEQQRDELRRRIARATEDLRKLREAETYQHLEGEVAPGYQGTLADVADAVMAARPRYGWMPAMPEQASPSPPLSVADALRLRPLLAAATATRTARRHQRLPNLSDLPSAEEVVAEADRIERADQIQDDRDPLVGTLGQVDPQTFAQIEQHLEHAANSLHQLGLTATTTDWRPEDWRSRALTDQLTRRNKILWEHLAATTRQVRAVAEEAIRRQGLHQVEIPDISPSELPGALRAAQRLWAHLEAGNKLRQRLQSPQQPAAAWLLSACTIDGHPPETAGDLRLIVERLKAEKAVAEATQGWAQVGASITPGAPGALAVRLSHLADQVADLQHIAAFGAARDAVDTLLVQQGIRLALTTAQVWDALRRAVVAARSQIAAASAAHQQQAEQWTCDTLLERLRAAHPFLADTLEGTATDPQWQDRLAELPKAWAWARARAFCEQQRTPGRDQRLQEELDEAEWRLGEVTGHLAAEHAWLHCLTRMKQQQRQALQAYKANMAELGEETGRYAPRYRRAAAQAMSIAQEAVPAWGHAASPGR